MSVTILGDESIEITADPVSENAAEVIPKRNIVAVFAAPFIERQAGDENWKYPYNSITQLIFVLADKKKLVLELQSVSNHPSWSDGTLSGLLNGHNDVHEWLENNNDLDPVNNPAINVNVTSLPAFSNTDLGSFSASKTFIVSGTNLLGNLIVNPPSGFIVNQDDSDNDEGPISFVPNGSNAVTPKTIYVKFSPLVGGASYSANITCSSTGALTQNVAVSGVANSPEITVSESSLSFSEGVIGEISASMTYEVSGKNLNANITVSLPSGFIGNLDDSEDDDGPISLVPVNGTVAVTTIYVRFVPVAEQSYSGNITNASTGASTKNVGVSGEGGYEYIEAIGGIMFRDGDYIYHVFNESNDFEVSKKSVFPDNNEIEYLLIGGGGGGAGSNLSGAQAGGGGNAGQVLSGTFTPSAGILPVVIGAGGAGGAHTVNGSSGGNSTFNSLTANGGAGGVVGNTLGGDGAGGSAGADSGGIGAQYSITGRTIYYAGGGASGKYNAAPAAGSGIGGLGGGGNAASPASISTGQAALPNTGSGGGGASQAALGVGNSGGNAAEGLCIVRYLSPAPIGSFIDASGGSESTDGDYKVHIFDSSDDFEIISAPYGASVEICAVAGGGGGGGGVGGGGGAGGVLPAHVIVPVGTYPVVIGAGGAGGLGLNRGTIGNNSTFANIVVYGGGGGATGAGGTATTAGRAIAGGSGGGGARLNNLGSPGSPGLGNFGGGGLETGSICSGGGGGAGAAGAAATSTKNGNGGNGTATNITGAALTFGGGGGGGGFGEGANRGLGGSGGGGNGANGAGTPDGSAGTSNTGGGGGGARGNADDGGDGGSGKWIFRYKFQ